MDTPLTKVSARPWRDAWLLPVLDGAGLLEPNDVTRLRATGAATVWEACIAASIATDDVIERTVAARFRLPLADVESVAPGEAAALLPGELAVRLRVVPLGLEDTALQLACSDPTDFEIEQAVAFGSGRRVRLRIASPSAVARALVRIYPAAAVGLAVTVPAGAPSSASAPPAWLRGSDAQASPAASGSSASDPAAGPRLPDPQRAGVGSSRAGGAAEAARTAGATTYEEFDAFCAALLAECGEDSHAAAPPPPLRTQQRGPQDAWARRIPRPLERPAEHGAPPVHCVLPEWL